MLKEGLSIDTTFNPDQFSSDSTFNILGAAVRAIITPYTFLLFIFILMKPYMLVMLQHIATVWKTKIILMPLWSIVLCLPASQVQACVVVNTEYFPSPPYRGRVHSWQHGRIHLVLYFFNGFPLPLFQNFARTNYAVVSISQNAKLETGCIQKPCQNLPVEPCTKGLN